MKAILSKQEKVLTVVNEGTVIDIRPFFQGKTQLGYSLGVNDRCYKIYYIDDEQEAMNELIKISEFIANKDSYGIYNIE